MGNSYEQQQLDLVKERDELKSQVNSLLKACKLYGDCFGCSNPESDEADTIVLLTPEQCLNSVRLSAIRDLASTEFPVSGYIIQSRKQILQWADFEEACNNESNQS